MQYPRRIREFVSAVEDCGFDVEKVSQGKHFKIRTRQGPVFICPVSASDHRAVANFRATVRRSAREPPSG